MLVDRDFRGAQQMYAEIHARDELKDSSGKTMWVSSNDISVEISLSSPKHLDSPPWHIQLKTENYDESSGELGGEVKGVTRMLEVHLTPDDVSKLLNLVLEKGLLAISVTTREATPKA